LNEKLFEIARLQQILTSEFYKVLYMPIEIQKQKKPNQEGSNEDLSEKGSFVFGNNNFMSLNKLQKREGSIQNDSPKVLNQEYHHLSTKSFQNNTDIECHKLIQVIHHILMECEELKKNNPSQLTFVKRRMLSTQNQHKKEISTISPTILLEKIAPSSGYPTKRQGDDQTTL